jgi:hypothetical protein
MIRDSLIGIATGYGWSDRRSIPSEGTILLSFLYSLKARDILDLYFSIFINNSLILFEDIYK